MKTIPQLIITTIILVTGCSNATSGSGVILPSANSILQGIDLSDQVDFTPVYKGEDEPEIRELKKGGKKYTSTCKLFRPGSKKEVLVFYVKQEINTGLKRSTAFLKNYHENTIPKNVESEFIEVGVGAIYQKYSEEYQSLWVLYGDGSTDISISANEAGYSKDLLIHIAQEVQKKYF